MKKDTILVVLFVILVLLGGTISILSNVLVNKDTKTLEIICGILFAIIAIGTYIYYNKK